MKEDRILPEEAAIIMGASPMYVRVGLRTGQLNIGTAVKMSSEWTYNIQRSQLEAEVKRDIGPELEQIRSRKVQKRKTG